MKTVLEMFDVDMKVGDTVKIKVFIDPEADRFAISLGKDDLELALHFNPRFDDDQDDQVIVFNSKEDGEWCTEQREDSFFMFEKGECFKFSITFLGEKFEIKLPDYVLEFSNRTSMDTMTFLSVQGDVRVKSLKFDY
ncbi:16 kDa beta-galactoside-binding lectin-like [Scyliorhinus torazame]|uniref:16 kDa beta-galactoside-binding lectin-like n=1 Tax=Scyliorhinus torazame TaxID=75743 RepID=UPI003B5C8962